MTTTKRNMTDIVQKQIKQKKSHITTQLEDVTVWEASDGKQFLFEEEAKVYVNRIIALEQLKNWPHFLFGEDEFYYIADNVKLGEYETIHNMIWPYAKFPVCEVLPKFPVLMHVWNYGGNDKGLTFVDASELSEWLDKADLEE